jgi:hypothetical protein
MIERFAGESNRRSSRGLATKSETSPGTTSAGSTTQA